MEGMMVFTVVSGMLWTYSILCTLRILATWMPGAAYGTPIKFLSGLTDPYLNLWRRFRFLVISGFDFSPVAALACLSIFATLTGILGSYGSITVGITLAVLFQAVMSMAGFLLFFATALIGMRLLAFLFRANSLNPLWKTVDSLINPLLFSVSRVFFGKRIVKYRTTLIAGLALFLTLMIVTDRLTAFISHLLAGLPF